MRLRRALGLGFCLLGVGLPTAVAQTTLRFVAIGDTPYSADEEARLQREVAAAIATTQPAFVVHYGDFKGGGETCTSTLFQTRRDQIFNLDPGRVFFTPGDNDWTDCDRPFLRPPVSELAQLDLLRQLFFAEPLTLPEQWAYASQPNYPENARWIHSGVVFATVHVVGTNNGRQQILIDDVDVALAQVAARDEANQRWLDAAFDEARAQQAQAVVIVIQADVTQPGGRGSCTVDPINCDAFADFRAQLTRHASQFQEEGQPRKPVLLIHGDTFPFCLDQQFGGETVPNLWRLNAWGDGQSPVDATEIMVQLDRVDQPFSARTLVGREAPAQACT